MLVGETLRKALGLIQSKLQKVLLKLLAIAHRTVDGLSHHALSYEPTVSESHHPTVSLSKIFDHALMAAHFFGDDFPV